MGKEGKIYQETSKARTNSDIGTCSVFNFTNLDPKRQVYPNFKAKKKTDVKTFDVS